MFPWKHLFFILSVLISNLNFAQSQNTLQTDILSALKSATKYFDEKIDSRGRFVWYYTLDLTRRWGEMEAYPSMAWIQGQGSVQMGETFLDLFEATQDSFYLQLALKTARTIAEGQLECGGWNYMIDFAGKESIQKWYNTIGKNGWRLEEFHYYYDNGTFDDEVTIDATMFLLRMELILPTPEIKKALYKAIDFVKQSQYPIGGWPQRYPPNDSLYKIGYPIYTSYYTFNDNVTWNNLCFLIACEKILGDTTVAEPIRRGMDFYLLTQLPAPQAGWAQQYSFDLRPASARTYEPAALDPIYTAKHIEILIKYYEMTGDKKYLACIPDALKWIESVVLSRNNNIVFVPKFVELSTNKPLYTHRRGSNVKFGKYYVNYDDKNTLGHYRSVRPLNLDMIIKIYQETLTKEITPCAILSIPCIDNIEQPIKRFDLLRKYLALSNDQWISKIEPTVEQIREILTQLDSEGRWPTKFAMITNPYIGDPQNGDSLTNKYAETYVGDKYDTSPFQNPSSEKFISTSLYIWNVQILLSFLRVPK